MLNFFKKTKYSPINFFEFHNFNWKLHENSGKNRVWFNSDKSGFLAITEFESKIIGN